MIVQAAKWAVLFLLLVCMAATSDALALSIQSMDWSYDGTDTTVKVCTDETDLAGASLTLTVTNSENNPEDIDGNVDSDTMCGNFVKKGEKMPPSSFETEYTFAADFGNIFQKSGSVTFSLEGNTILCDTNEFQRFKLGNGNVEGSLITSAPGMSAQYISVTGFEDTDIISFSELDESASGFLVTVEKQFFNAAPDVGTFTADVFDYRDMSFTFTSADDSASLTELLMTSDGGNLWNAIPCDPSLKCTDSSLVQSNHLFELCGILTDNEEKVVSSGHTTFQDLDLTVDLVGSTVDFHFANSNGDKMYNIYSLNDGGAENLETTLNCVNIDDGICNGFFEYTNEKVAMAVAYNSGDVNKIIAAVQN